MRIIGGRYRGKKLYEFEGEDIRPTSDRAKEGLFNVLQLRVNGASFLDAFSGSGAIGIEALSRGASGAVFLDSAKDAVELVKKNLASVSEKAEVYCIDAVNYLEKCDKRFDIIFIDPPYASNSGVVAAEVIINRGLLTDNGILIYEHKREDNRAIEGLSLIKSKYYGIAAFDFYEVKR